MIKILHIAPQNFAGMPFDFSNMQKQNGFGSVLVTLYKNTLNFEEDICLKLPLKTGNAAKNWRDKKIRDKKYYETKNQLEKFYFVLRDIKNSNKINKCINDNNLYHFDIVHFDGGMDLFRDIRFAKKMKSMGKKIVCCYFGSDLRTRGIFKELDDMSDLNLTVEYDHLQLHDDINYLFFPFDVKKYEYKFVRNKGLKIIHSPTNRRFKGTDKIIKVIEEVKKKRKIEFLLMENTDRSELLELKKKCNLAIDQVGGEMGGSGYGKNSVENLAMGLPTITEFTPDYLKFIPENPFIHCDIDTLKSKLLEIADNNAMLEEYSVNGRKWVEKYHSFESVNAKLNELYRSRGII